MSLRLLRTPVLFVATRTTLALRTITGASAALAASLALTLTPARATVTPYANSPLPDTSTYAVTADGTPIRVENVQMTDAAGNNADKPIAGFAFTDTVSVSVTPNYAFTSYKVLPAQYHISATRSGSTITFTLPESDRGKVVVEFDNDYNKSLFLFADPPVPAIPSGARVFNAGAHTGHISVASNETVYLAPGAVITGDINMHDVSNARVIGRGWYLGSLWVERTSNCSISGVHGARLGKWTVNIKDSSGFSIDHLKLVYQGGETDGISWNNSNGCSAKNSFIMNHDDVFTSQRPHCKDNLTENIVVWSNGGGNIFGPGGTEDIGGNNVYRDIYIVRGKNNFLTHHWSNGPRNIGGYLFENIYCDPRVPFSSFIYFNGITNPGTRYYTLRNVHAPWAPSRIDASNCHFTFDNVVLGGTKMTSISQMGMNNLGTGNNYSFTNGPYLAHWRFEDGAVGEELAATDGTATRRTTDSTGNGNLLQTYHVGAPGTGTSPEYRPDVPFRYLPGTGAANTRAFRFDGNDDIYSLGAPLNSLTSLPALTVEVSVRFATLGGYQTFVGRDGSSIPGDSETRSASAYFQLAQDPGRADHVAIKLHQDNGTLVTTYTAAPVVPGRWYSFAAVADGSTLKLYSVTAGVATLESSVPFVGAVTSTSSTWTVGRGMWSGSPADWVKDGTLIDEVRLSAAALAPAAFLAVTNPATTPPNTAPVFPPQAARTVPALAPFTLATPATDAEAPPQTLAYALVNPPAGASIDASGTFSWVPALAQAGQTFPIRITATDDGSPALTATLDFALTVGPPPPPPVAGVNLLLNNPGFETPGDFYFGNGAYSFPGWTGQNYRFHGNHVVNGSPGGAVSTGSRAFRIQWGGVLSTAPADRAAVQPGFVYRLGLDLRNEYEPGNPPQDDWLGATPILSFFDAQGRHLKDYYGPDWTPQVQAAGPAGWARFAVTGLAPPGAVFAGVTVLVPTGIYPREDVRHVSVDNIRLEGVPEALDRLAVRRAPRLVEPSRSAVLRIHHATTAPRVLSARLLDSDGLVRASAALPVAAGRGLATLSLAIPADLPDGDHAWQIGLLPSADAWPAATATLLLDEVFSDRAIAAPGAPGTGDIPASDPRILRVGRWDEATPARPWMNWYASEIRARFTGPTLTLLGGCADNGFGGPSPVRLRVVLDDDETTARDILVDNFNLALPLATGLADGPHTVRLFKLEESDRRFRFDGLRVAAGRGLLRPEPLPARRVEIFGDSVTSGSSATPSWLGYAPLLGRELDADLHVISKGGTGVASSFSGLSTLLGYWDRLDFPNPFDGPSARPWDFSRWTPQAVVIAIGHNDQFNNGSATFRERYADFHAALRARYPAARILATNTVISANARHFQRALDPLLALDSALAFAFQRSAWTPLVDDHPPAAGHAAMVYGDATRFSLADELERHLGWGLDRPLDGYEQWALARFSAADLAAGRHAPALDPDADGTANLLEYALGSDPLAPSPAPAPSLTPSSPPSLSLSFTRHRADLRYLVEVSSDLAAWSVAATDPGTLGVAHTWTDSIPLPGRRFARLRVEPR